ncbi:hypothetical protein GGI19_002706 [Coemansia pectinata]|uniref:Uncharacterized protein n=1 Tax=Coemansia pectinata TaxID=1052879 RepID=A0A9W8LBN5_9FUNG|nr:hypothetical protein GGI19_002706 [Coemansia pectinata]
MSTLHTSQRAVSDSDSGSSSSSTTGPSTPVASVNYEAKGIIFQRRGPLILVGVVDAMRARLADYAQDKAVPLGVMKNIPSSVVGAVAHDLQLERSQKQSSTPLRQVPGKEKTGMLARPSAAFKQPPSTSESHSQSASKPFAKSKPTEIAVPTNSARQQLQRYTQAVNERYRVANLPSVTPGAQKFTPLNSQTSGGTRVSAKGSLSSVKGDIDQGLSELVSGLASLSIAESLSVDTPPELTITLKPHQLSGVAWMLHNERNEDVRGGIIGDDMGLGKTVQALSLLMAHPPENGGSHSTLVVVPLATVEHWRNEAETRVQRGALKAPPAPEELALYDAYGTLLVDWCDPGDVDFGSLTAAQRELRDQKVLDLKSCVPLFGLRWWRVILDEAHETKNAKTKKSMACHDLVARYRWCLSGTPIQNSISDVYSLLRFLRFRPFCDNDPDGRLEMRAILSKLMLRRDKLTMTDSKPTLDLPQRYFYFHAVDLSIAERIYYDCVQKQAAEFSMLSRRNQNNYVMLFTLLLRLRQTTSHLLISSEAEQDDDSIEGGSESDSPTLEHFGLLKVGMPISISVDRFWRFTDDTVRNIPIGLAHAGPESPDKCAHCSNDIDHLKGIWVYRCGAFLCCGCVKDGLNPTHCGACKLQQASGYELNVSEIAQNGVDSASPDNRHYFARCIFDKCTEVSPDMIKELRLVYSDEGASGSSCPSSKMRKTLSILKAIRCGNPEDKCVVFCEHLKAISLNAAFIKKHSFSSIVYQGAMSKKQRDNALVSFASDKDIPVLFVSKKAGAMGINLTAANHIILEGSWWTPAIDGQAIDCIYRIGQTKSVHVHILAAQGTVDEKLQAIQKSKRGLIDSIIDQATDDDSKKITTSDMRHILQDITNAR